MQLKAPLKRSVLASLITYGLFLAPSPAVMAAASSPEPGSTPSPADEQEQKSKQRSGEISIRSTTTLENVQVTARNAKVVSSGGLGARSILDTPFSVSAVDQQEILDRQAVMVTEILKGDAAARTASNGVVSIIPEVTVRGLLLDQLNSYKIDGMAFPNRTSLPAEHFQQVELLKGLSGFMYGFGTPGGIINYISKRPKPNDPTLTLSSGFSSDGTFKGVVDANLQAGANDAAGLRFVGVREQGDTYVDDNGHLKRTSASLATTFHLNDVFTLLADGLYQKRATDGVIYATYLPAADASIPLPAPVDGRSNLAETGSFYHDTTKVATVSLDMDISYDWKASLSYRYADMDAAWREGDVNVFNAAGDYRFREYVGLQNHKYDQLQFLSIGQWQTGPVSHELTFGASWQKLMQYNDATSGTYNLDGVSNLYRPTRIVGSFMSPYTHDLFKALEIEQKALFASDTLSWGRFSFLAGLRYNQFEQSNLNAAGTLTASYKANPVTPTASIRFKPREDMMIYVSYVEALEKGGQASVIHKNYGEIFGPLESNQYEVGFKTEQKFWDASIAAFRIERGAEYTRIIDRESYYVQDGLSRFQGVEGSVNLRPTDEISLNLSGMYLDAKLVEGAINVGNRIPGAAEWQGAVQLEYAPRAIQGLKFIGSMNYLGESKLEASNMRSVPGFVTADLAARYTLGTRRPVTLYAALKNIADRRYWTIRNSGTPALQQGAPQTVALGMSVAF